MHMNAANNERMIIITKNIIDTNDFGCVGSSKLSSSSGGNQVKIGCTCGGSVGAAFAPCGIDFTI